MTGDAFADRLAALSRDERAAFVAAVYDARGWTVGQDGHEVVATPPGSDRTHRLVTTADGTTVATRDDGTSLDAADLLELLTYALGASDRERVCRRFFDCAPDCLWSDDGDSGATVAPADGPRDDASGDAGGSDDGTPSDPATAVTAAGDDDTPATDGSDGSGGGDRTGSEWSGPWSRRALLVGVAVTLVVGTIAAAAGPAFAPTGDAGTDAGGTNATAVGNNASAAADIGSNGTTPTSFPPGVDAEGITSVLSIAGAHAEALSGRSYRIHILHREYVDGRLRGVAEERIAVESSDRYRSRVRVVGTVEHAEPLVEEESVYANGTTLYARPVEGVEGSERERDRDRDVRRTTREPTTPNRVVDRSRRYVRWYLGVEESRVTDRTTRDGRTEVRVGMEGDSWPGSRNVTGEARVDERGLVRVVRRTSTPLGEPSVRVVITIRVRLEPVTVTRPGWVDRVDSGSTSGSAGTRTTTTDGSNATTSASKRVEP